MIIRKAIVLLAMMIAFASWKVKATLPTHQISGSTNMYILLNDVGDDDVETSLHVNGSYAYTISKLFQAYAGTSIKVGDIVNSYTLMIGPIINIPVSESRKIQNAFFILPKIGLGLLDYEYTYWGGSTVSKTTTEGLWGIGIGKRFALSENISLATSISTVKWMDPLPRNKNDFDVYFDIFYINVHF